MKKAILMGLEEPTDKQLFDLMHEVALEAKRKAVLAKAQLTEKIKHLVAEASKK